MKRTAQVCAIVSVLTALSGAQTAPAQQPPDTLYRLNPRYEKRCAEWRADTVRSAVVVMLGNSITEGGAWAGLLGRGDVVNRGIGSDNTYGFLHRMSFVTDLHPRVCFIMGGINDVYAGFSVPTILRNVAGILDTLRAQGIIPVVQSTLFASPKWHHAMEKNILVRELNEGLRTMCTGRGVPFMDLNPLLAPEGTLLDEYTSDGIHLTQPAYDVWARQIRGFLRLHRL